MRPKECDHPVAASKALRARECQIYQQRTPLRLAKECFDITPIAGVQVERAKCPQFDHRSIDDGNV